MSSNLDEGERVARDFDDSACEFCERYKTKGLSKSSKVLLDFLVADGVKEKSTLELGCGAGGFTMELVNQGAASAVGIDLSVEMIKAANELSHARGAEDRVKYWQGNAATADLPQADIVVMDKVICCYSDIGSLMKNATSASRDLVGFIVPRDEGILKWPLRLGVWIGNVIQKRRKSIFFYLHSLPALDKSLRESGFTRRQKKSSRFWLVFLYGRTNA